MFKFIKFELQYWLKTPMLWIFMFIYLLLIALVISTDNVSIGGGVGNVYKNAPHAIQSYYGNMLFVILLTTTAFMNSSASRDLETGMYQFIFTSPIKKLNYFFGKFIGAYLAALIPTIGISLGAIIGPFLPWAEDNIRYGAFNLSGHLAGFLVFAVPNTLIIASVIFAVALFFRSSIISFVSAILLLILYIISSTILNGLEKEFLASLFDPFGSEPFSIASKYLTVDEKNSAPMWSHQSILLNRSLWIFVGIIVLLFTYSKFSFSVRSKKVKTKKMVQNHNEVAPPIIPNYVPTYQFSWGAFWSLIRFEVKAIVRNPVFIIIMIFGILLLAVSLTNFTGMYDTSNYPTSSDVIETIKGSFYIFIIAIITFYSGVIVWRERDAKLNDIKDAMPFSFSVLFTAKTLALIFVVAIILFTCIIVGVVTQLAYGFFDFNIKLYFMQFMILELLRFVFLIVASLFIHVLINNRYISYFAFVIFVIVNGIAWSNLNIESNLVQYGSRPSIIYSDLYQFKPYVKTTLWFNLYWCIAAVIISVISYSLYQRGKETRFKYRIKSALVQFKHNGKILIVLMCMFILCGGFIYYNTKVLNTFDSRDVTIDRRLQYELKYKKYETLPLPRIYAIKHKIELFPKERNLNTYSEMLVRNESATPIKELHFTVPTLSDSLRIDIKDAKQSLKDDYSGYIIYTLAKPLMPEETLLIRYRNSYINRGFENEISFISLTENGTFFNNSDFMPYLGYINDNEISDKNRRRKKKLPEKLRSPILNEADSLNRGKTYVNNADWCMVETEISTDADQTAIAPGDLIKKWNYKNRNYFKYKLTRPSLNFTSFLSAKYDVKTVKFDGVSAEVYYHPTHAYNVPNMLSSIQKSLTYYINNFGPYYHKECRIVEFPRHSSFAQAFPGTMPYSEGIGFISDLRDVKEDDIDPVYYVVAHEMGHQYWAHQLVGSNMQGSTMLSESFAQYSALMVMEKEYGKDKMKKFLKYEMDSYLSGRSSEPQGEKPLQYVEDQDYVYYRKASVVMYYLKEMIGEAKVNEALRSLIDSFAYKRPPYATSLDAMRAFRKVTPDSLKYILKDLFEDITLYSNKIVDCSYKKTGDKYEVTIKTNSLKHKANELGKETQVRINDYIDIAIFEESTSQLTLGKPLLYKRVKIDQENNMFKFVVDKKPYQAGIDPYNYLIDRVPDDNLKKLVNN
jgi:ABC-2 type transport system permease protein